jgi:hypothetical protein
MQKIWPFSLFLYVYKYSRTFLKRNNHLKHCIFSKNTLYLLAQVPTDKVQY